MDGNGTSTIAWSTQDGIYAATRKPGAPVGKPQFIARSMSTELRLAVNEGGDAVLAWAQGGSGTTYATVRAAGGSFGPPQVIHDPVLDSATNPSVAIAPSGWAVAVAPSGDLGTTFVAALRPPGRRFGSPQRVSDSTGSVPYGVGAGIDSRGDALVAFGAADCPNLPPDYRCDYPVKASMATAGGRFAEPKQIGRGSRGIYATPSVAVSPGGHATVGFIACLVPHYCVDESQVVDADLPGGFGTPVTIAKATADHGNPPAGETPWLAPLADGSSLAWLSNEGSRDVLFAKRDGGKWPAAQRAGGDKHFLAGPLADGEGDVVYGGPPRYGRPPGCAECEVMQVQRWSATSATLSEPVALSPVKVGSGVVAPGPGERMVAAWAEATERSFFVVRAYEEMPAPSSAAAKADSSAPVLAVVAPPRAAAPVMRLRATCDEACSVSATGVLRVGTRAFRVAAPRRAQRGDGGVTLPLAVRARDRRGVRRALRGQGRRSLTVRIAARDRTGNRRVIRKSFRFRRGG